MADHTGWAIAVVAALLRLGVITTADAPTFLAGRIITAVTIIAAAPIDLSALILNASLTIIALRIVTAARLIFHRNTDAVVLIDALAFGPFRAITVGLARDNAEPALW